MQHLKVQTRWTGNNEEWRWQCAFCWQQGHWQSQSPGAALELGRLHLKRKHPTVTERI